MSDDDRRRVATSDQIYGFGRQLDRDYPLPTDEHIRQVARDEIRQFLGTIGLDVSDPIKQSKTAAEIVQWREASATFSSVVKKVLMTAAAVIGTAIGGAIVFTVGGRK